MKTPVDIVEGVITDVSDTGIVTIQCQYDDWPTLVRRQYRKCRVQMIDSRPLSDKQRKACYALLAEIADYTGQGKDPTKEWMKLKFLAEDLGETADSIFSLSSAPMSLVCAFQRFLVRFLLDWDIPTRFPLLNFVDDTADYIYACLIHRKCCICGKRAELHHVDHIGMGRDRTEVVHEGMEALPLCRAHHDECHTLGQQRFNEAYHIERGIVLDRTLCRIYGLKRRKKDVESHRTDGPPDAGSGAAVYAEPAAGGDVFAGL